MYIGPMDTPICCIKCQSKTGSRRRCGKVEEEVGEEYKMEKKEEEEEEQLDKDYPVEKEEEEKEEKEEEI